MPAPTPTDLNEATENLMTVDRQTNDKTLTTVNRFGSTVQTITGALTNFGYLPPVTFAAGILIDKVQQLVREGGVDYAANPDQIPFTTTAVFDPAQWYVPALSNSNRPQTSIENIFLNGAMNIYERGPAVTVPTGVVTQYGSDRFFYRSGATNVDNKTLNNIDISGQISGLSRAWEFINTGPNAGENIFGHIAEYTRDRAVNKQLTFSCFVKSPADTSTLTFRINFADDTAGTNNDIIVEETITLTSTFQKITLTTPVIAAGTGELLVLQVYPNDQSISTVHFTGALMTESTQSYDYPYLPKYKELPLCKYYHEVLKWEINSVINSAQAQSITSASWSIDYKEEKRANPSAVKMGDLDMIAYIDNTGSAVNLPAANFSFLSMGVAALRIQTSSLANVSVMDSVGLYATTFVEIFIDSEIY